MEFCRNLLLGSKRVHEELVKHFTNASSFQRPGLSWGPLDWQVGPSHELSSVPTGNTKQSFYPLGLSFHQEAGARLEGL